MKHALNSALCTTLPPTPPRGLTLPDPFTHQGLADWLSVKRLGHWTRAAGYSGRRTPEQLHTRLTGAPRGATGDDGLAEPTSLAYLTTLRVLRAAGVSTSC